MKVGKVEQQQYSLVSSSLHPGGISVLDCAKALLRIIVGHEMTE